MSILAADCVACNAKQCYIPPCTYIQDVRPGTKVCRVTLLVAIFSLIMFTAVQLGTDVVGVLVVF